MDPKLLAFFVVASSLVSVAAVAPLYTHLSLSGGRNDVDHVTLYENGLAAISLVRTFASSGGTQTLTFQVPTTAMFQTLTLAGDGIVVEELRSALSSKPVLEPGDRLVVHLDDKTMVEGTLVSRDGGSLLLATGDGTTLAQEAHATAIEVAGRRIDPRSTGSTDVAVRVTAAAGERTVRLSYLAQGAGWEPHYSLDARTGDLTFFASLTGMQDWANVTLDLVSGNPNRVYAAQGSDYSYRGLALDSSSSAGAGSPSGFAPSQSLGDLHRYHYAGSVSFAQGETVRLPVASGRVPLLRHFYTTTLGPYATAWQGLAETYRIRNSLAEPLPAGRIDVTLGPEWIGSDSLPDLGRGEDANVTVAHSGEVKGRVQVASERVGEPGPADQFGHRFRTRATAYDVQVRNLRAGQDAGVDLHLGFQAGGYRTIAAQTDPRPSEESGDWKAWDRSVAGGETAHFRVTLERTEDA